MKNSFEHLLPVYPYIAKQIIDDYQITKGKCLDIGTGHGYVGIELAKRTELEMYFIDINPEMLEIAKKNVEKAEINNKVQFLNEDVCNLSFEDESVDFIVSRGSLWFWENQVKGLQEINRVLKKGCVAFVGGGLGRYTPDNIRKEIQGKGRQKQIQKGEKGFIKGKELKELVQKTGIPNARVISDAEEFPATWIEIRK